MLDKTVDQYRKASDTGDPVEDWAEVVADIRMAIYPAGTFSIANFQSPYTNIQFSHVGYGLVSAATWQVGDRVIHGSIIYTVLDTPRIWDALIELKLGIV